MASTREDQTWSEATPFSRKRVRFLARAPGTILRVENPRPAITAAAARQGLMGRSGSNLGPLVGLVLAGGESARMGGKDKPSIALGGKPMLARAIERIGSEVERLVVSANGDPTRYSAFDTPILPDRIGAGPLSGLLEGMRWSEANLPKARFVASVAADTPFFPADLIERLSDGCGRDENTVALASSSGGVHPVFGLWPVALADGLQKFLQSDQNPKVLAFADRFMRLNVPFDDLVLPNGETVDPFFNVNTPEDFARAEAMLAILEGRAAVG